MDGNGTEGRTATKNEHCKKKVKVKGKMMKIPFFQSCNSTEALMKRENTMHDDNDIASQKDTHRTKQKSKQNYANT